MAGMSSKPTIRQSFMRDAPVLALVALLVIFLMIDHWVYPWMPSRSSTAFKVACAVNVLIMIVATDVYQRSEQKRLGYVILYAGAAILFASAILGQLEGVLG